MKDYKYDKEFIESMFPVGTRIVVDHMDDPRPVESGTGGTVECVDDIGQIHCAFDNGRCIALIYGLDKFHKE